MESERFDTAARVLGTRRIALTGLIGGVAALLGLGGADQATALGRLGACRQLADLAKRRRCLRRARARDRRSRCKPKPPVTFCQGRCSGTVVNNCEKQVACPTCTTGKACLGNGSCARTCQDAFDPTCPAGCRCEGPEVGGGFRCITGGLTCDQVPQVCTSTLDCPTGFFCAEVTCRNQSGVQENRCLPLCQT